MNIAVWMRRSAFALPVAVVMALALLFISEISYRSAREALDARDLVSAMSDDVRRLLQSVTDAETGARGYVITGQAEYLDPYRKAVVELPPTVARIDAYFREDADAGNPMLRIRLLVERRMSTTAEVVRLRQAGQQDQVAELIARESGSVLKTMDEIRRATQQLLDVAAQRGDASKRYVARALLVSRIGVSTMAVLGLVVLVAYLRQRGVGDIELGQLRESVRVELQTQVEDRTRELALLARHLQSAREDERSRLARALHDELGALLTAAKFDVARIRTRVARVSPEAVERLEHMNETLNQVIALTRRITEDLRPSSLGNLGLAPALEILTREFAASADIRVDCALEPVSLTPSRELTVFRLVQEGLTNISKYAKAGSVRVTLEARDGQAIVSVADDGAGFEMQGAKMGSYGLLGMRYRVEGEGGHLSVKSTPGAGTRLSAALPLGPETDAPA